MPIALHWLDAEQTILYMRFHNHWTLEDLYTALERAHRWVEQVSQPVRAIADLRDIHTFPSGLITHSHTALQSRPHNMQMAVVIMTSSMLMQVYLTAIRFYQYIYPNDHLPIRTVQTLEEALRLVGYSDDARPLSFSFDH